MITSDESNTNSFYISVFTFFYIDDPDLNTLVLPPLTDSDAEAIRTYSSENVPWKQSFIFIRVTASEQATICSDINSYDSKAAKPTPPFFLRCRKDQMTPKMLSESKAAVSDKTNLQDSQTNTAILLALREG